MTLERFVIDTTVLEDYFQKKDNNVTKWLDKIFSQDTDQIIILNSVLAEFTRRTHYRKSKKYNLKILIQAFQRMACVRLIDQDIQSIKRLIKNMKTFPISPVIHFGEFTLLQENDNANSVIVSSDKGPLIAYKTKKRINPQYNPPKEFLPGISFS